MFSLVKKKEKRKKHQKEKTIHRAGTTHYNTVSLLFGCLADQCHSLKGKQTNRLSERLHHKIKLTKLINNTDTNMTNQLLLVSLLESIIKCDRNKTVCWWLPVCEPLWYKPFWTAGFRLSHNQGSTCSTDALGIATHSVSTIEAALNKQTLWSA